MSRKTSRLAKLSGPRLHDAVLRDRLFAHLDELAVRSCTWVSGPPGAGKTTLVATWLDARGIDCVWYQMDPGDADPSTFFYYLREAAIGLGSRKRPLPLLTPEYLLDLPGFTRRFFRKFFSLMNEGSVLVLDNCHEIDGQLLGPLLAEALREVPAGISVIAVSRTPPPAELIRMQANHQLAVLGWQELRLTQDESSEILRRGGITANERIAELHRLADGWVAALVLLSVHSKRGGLQATLSSLETNEAVFDYFAGEIFSKAPSEHRELLKCTCLLPEVTPQMAVELSGNSAAARILADLYQGQSLIDRRVAPELTYRYHDLFREFLLSRLQQETAPQTVRALQRRAGELLADRGDAAQAVKLFQQGGHFDAAAATILQHAPALLSQGRWQTLQAWIGGLPAQLLHDNPWLRYWLGLARMQVNLQEACQILGETHPLFSAAGDQLGQVLCGAAIIHAYYYEYNDFSQMDVWIARLDELLAAQMSFPEPGSELFVYAALVLAGTFRQPGHPLLLTRVRRAAELIGMAVETNQRVSAAIALLSYYSFSLHVEEADRLIDDVTPLIHSAEVTALNQVFWWLFVGNYIEGRALRYAQGRKYFDLADKIAADNGLRQTELLSRAFRAYSLIGWGEPPETFVGLLQELSQLVNRQRPMDAAQFHLAALFAALLAGDSKQAALHAERGVAATQALGIPYISVGWKASAAVGHAMHREFAAAERMLDEAWAEATGTYLECFRPLMWLGRAYLSLRRGEPDGWQAPMRESFNAGKVRGMISIGWVPGVKDLMLAQALRCGIDTEYARSLAKLFRARPPSEPIEEWPWPIRVYTFGRFKLLIDDQPLVFAHKTPKKPIALLKVLIAFGADSISERQIADALWPDEQGDASAEALRVTLHRLRKLLGRDDAVQYQESRLGLNPDVCWTDVRAFEHGLQSRTAEDGDSSERPLALYRGNFLIDDGDEPWALSARERLRSKFIRHIGGIGRANEDRGLYAQALVCYERGIEIDDLAEDFYQGCMRCQLALGQHARGLATYRRLRKTLSLILGLAPSRDSESLFRALQQANPST